MRLFATAPGRLVCLIVLAAGGAILACPPEGDSKLANVKTADVLKNRSSNPPSANKVAISQLLAGGDDTKRFDSNDGAVITGYVAKVMPGGIESCNCHAQAVADRDTHIYVSADAQHTKPSQCVIVEVTPSLRAQHPDWTTANLKKTLQGKTVTFTGWLFFDGEHKQNAVNTNPTNKKDWRATVWEIHPVTGIN